MKAEEFNARYPVGSLLILRTGDVVKTVDVARDIKSCTIVEISLYPYFARVNLLTPVEATAV